MACPGAFVSTTPVHWSARWVGRREYRISCPESTTQRKCLYALRELRHAEPLAPAFEWFNRSIGDGYVDDAQIELWSHRIWRGFLVPGDAVQSRVWWTVLQWIRGAYYLGRRFPSQPELLRESLAEVYAVLERGQTELEDSEHRALLVEAAAYVADWATADGQVEQRAVQVLRSCADSESESRVVRKRAVLALALGLREQTSAERCARLQTLLDGYSDLFTGHERVQVLATQIAACEPDLDRSILELLEAIRTYRVDTGAWMPTRVDQLFGEASLFAIVQPVVHALAGRGAVVQAIQVIGAWLGVRDPRSDIAIALIGHPAGTVWVAPGLRIPEDWSEQRATLATLTDTVNRALHLRISGGNDLSVFESAEREGTPNYNEGEELDVQARRHLRLDDLELLLDHPAVGAILPIPTLPVPIQSLLVRRFGRSLPLAVSLRPPNPDRTVRRVLAWPTDTLFGRLETDAVRQTLEASGVRVDVAQAPLDLKHFRAVYADPRFDVLWFANHGEHHYTTPETSNFRIDEETRVTVTDLAELEPPDRGRRLLVLNCCDSGATAPLGGTPSIGIAAVAAGPRQAVIAHLWPSAWYSAAAFGVLLASGLTQRERFHQAFESALTRVQRSPEEVATDVETLAVGGADLAERLRRVSDDLTNLLVTGSPMFME